MKSIYLIIFIFSIYTVGAQNQAYSIFNAKNKISNFDKLFDECSKADIILFGELHNDPIAHWLQFELTKKMIATYKTNIVLGAEMFEADNQKGINDYLSGKIDEKSFDTLVRFWPNYQTDYSPLMALALENKIPFIATNIPRSFARIVFKKGFEGLDTLTAEQKSWIAPLPIEYDASLPGYVAMIEMMGGKDHASPNFPKAQAIKDATMAYFISKNWSVGKKFIHYHGTYHSNNFEGIYWYLNKLLPSAKIVTIATVSQSNCSILETENKGLANFTICVDEDMTKTH
jgi:uncharacterized iron-regulated protein